MRSVGRAVAAGVAGVALAGGVALGGPGFAKRVADILGSYCPERAQIDAYIAQHPELTSSTKYVGSKMLDHLNRERLDSRPSVGGLAHACGLSPRQTRRHARRIEQAGIAQKTERWRREPGMPARPSIERTNSWDFTPALSLSAEESSATSATSSPAPATSPAASPSSSSPACPSSSSSPASPAPPLWPVFRAAFGKAYAERYPDCDPGNAKGESQTRVSSALQVLTADAAAWAQQRGLDFDRERIAVDLAEHVVGLWFALDNAFLRSNRHKIGFFCGGKSNDGDFFKVRDEALRAWKARYRSYAPTSAPPSPRHAPPALAAPRDFSSIAAQFARLAEVVATPRAFIPRPVELASPFRPLDLTPEREPLPVVAEQLVPRAPDLDPPEPPPGRPPPS